MKVFFSAVVLSLFILQLDGFRVLGVIPFDSKSHFAIGNSILKCLHKAGHEVTVISSYPQKKPLDNYRDISTAIPVEEQAETGDA